MSEADSCTRNNSHQRQRSGLRSRSRRRAGEGHAFATALLSAALAMSVNPPHCRATESRRIKAIAYYYPRKFTERNGLAKPENIDFTKISRVNYASFQLDESGSIWGTDLNADAQILYGPVNWNPPSDAKKACHFTSPDTVPACQFYDEEKGLIRKAHAVGTRVFATIGGFDLSGPFTAVAADTKAREQFASKCARIISNYNFDGIDIDWRFPESAIDMANYSLLLSQVRDELDKLGAEQGSSYGLTATLPCSQDKIANIDILFLDLVLDEFNLLTVDFHGPWDGAVGVSAPLHDQVVGEQGLSVDSCVSTYLDAGASREKLNIALPLYGRSFSGASAVGQKCPQNWSGDCSDTVTWQEDSGSPQYFNIYKKLSELNITFDTQSMATFAYNDAGIVSFDDERSICLKTEYVIESELGGVFILELGGDLLDELSTPLLNAVNLKLLNNGLSCNSNAFMESLLRQEPIANAGRDEPIAHNEVSLIDKELSSIDFLHSEEIKQEYRYTCGFGEGDASKKCSKLGWEEGWEETVCNTGTCPEGQVCFLSLCDVIPVTPFVKPIPKGKPKRKPPKMSTSPSQWSTKAETSFSNSNSTLDHSNMTFSCGLNFQHAELCGQPCQNGLVDCPPGEFCFWLKCKPDSLTLVEASKASSPNLPEITVPQYKCGSTREDALTCVEDCGSSWQCSDGKYCFLIQCPM